MGAIFSGLPRISIQTDRITIEDRLWFHSRACCFVVADPSTYFCLSWPKLFLPSVSESATESHCDPWFKQRDVDHLSFIDRVPFQAAGVQLIVPLGQCDVFFHREIESLKSIRKIFQNKGSSNADLERAVLTYHTIGPSIPPPCTPSLFRMSARFLIV